MTKNKRRYMHGKRRRRSPLKTEQKEIKDNIKYDKETDTFYDKDIQKSYEQRRGRWDIKNSSGYKKWKKEQKDIDRLV